MLLGDYHIVHLVANVGKVSLQEYRNSPHTNWNRFMAFQNKTVTDCAVWQIIHDSVTAYRALASAASEGAWHLINSCQKYFKLASQKMMHITLEPTSENFSWYASCELELNLNLRKQGMLKHKDSWMVTMTTGRPKTICIANIYIYQAG